jgi:site-specific DNA-methyltransferase (adenine-specific)
LNPPRNRIITGDATAELRRLPGSSVDMVLTSPPYFRLRNYQVTGQLGQEAHVDQWVDQLRRVTHEISRVLTPTGSLWLNLADTYAAHHRQGAGRKGLLLGPERVASVMVQDGWLLRNKIIWAKTNPMPTSVRDRLSCTYEAIYLFVKQPEYFFDLDAIRVPHTSTPPRGRHRPSAPYPPTQWRGPNSSGDAGLAALKAAGLAGHPLGKNPGDVWQLASSNYRGAHHATFAVALAERAILAGCPEARCSRCRKPWRRPTIRALNGVAVRSGLAPGCDCGATPEAGLVLDPFFGAGSTAVAAERLKRDWLGIELNGDFASLAIRRLQEARASRVNPKTARP